MTRRILSFAIVLAFIIGGSDAALAQDTPPRPVILAQSGGKSFRGVLGSYCWPDPASASLCEIVDNPQPIGDIQVSPGGEILFTVAPAPAKLARFAAVLLDNLDESGEAYSIDLAPTDGLLKIAPPALVEGKRRVQIEAVYPKDVNGNQNFVYYVFSVNIVNGNGLAPEPTREGGGAATPAATSEGTAAATSAATAEAASPTNANAPTAATGEAVSPTEINAPTSATTGAISPTNANVPTAATGATVSPTEISAPTNATTGAISPTNANAPTATTAGESLSQTPPAPAASATPQAGVPTATSASGESTALPPASSGTPPISGSAAPTGTPAPDATNNNLPTAIGGGPTTEPGTPGAEVSGTPAVEPTAAPTSESAGIPTVSVPDPSAVFPRMTLSTNGVNYKPIAVDGCLFRQDGVRICVGGPANVNTPVIQVTAGIDALYYFEGPRPQAIRLSVLASDGVTIISQSQVEPPENNVLFTLPSAPGSYVLSIEVTYKGGKATYYFRALLT